MNLVCEGGNFLLLAQVEVPLVHAVGYNGSAKLAPAQVVQNQPLFTGVDDLAVIQGFKLFGKLGFLGKALQGGKNLVVHGPGAEVKVHACAHGHGVGLDPLRAAVAAHGRHQIHPFGLLQCPERRQGIHVVPCDHICILLNLYS